jgi:hypothetical protein
VRGVHGRHPHGEARTGRGRITALLAVTGALLLIVSGTAIARGQGISEAGGAEVARLSSPPGADGSRQPSVTVTDGRILPSNQARPPVALRVAAIGLSAQVDPVGVVAGSGEFDVPPSVDRVGWYRYGPGLEASAGSVVIAGHVDSAAQGRGGVFPARRALARRPDPG